MTSTKVLIWASRILAGLFIFAGACKISFPVVVNASFLEGALKVLPLPSVYLSNSCIILIFFCFQ
jgi:hypothetical protein